MFSTYIEYVWPICMSVPGLHNFLSLRCLYWYRTTTPTVLAIIIYHIITVRQYYYY